MFKVFDHKYGNLSEKNSKGGKLDSLVAFFGFLLLLFFSPKATVNIFHETLFTSLIFLICFWRCKLVFNS